MEVLRLFLKEGLNLLLDLNPEFITGLGLKKTASYGGFFIF